VFHRLPGENNSNYTERLQAIHFDFHIPPQGAHWIDPRAPRCAHRRRSRNQEEWLSGRANMTCGCQSRFRIGWLLAIATVIAAGSPATPETRSAAPPASPAMRHAFSGVRGRAKIPISRVRRDGIYDHARNPESASMCWRPSRRRCYAGDQAFVSMSNFCICS